MGLLLFQIALTVIIGMVINWPVAIAYFAVLLASKMIPPKHER